MKRLSFLILMLIYSGITFGQAKTSATLAGNYFDNGRPGTFKSEALRTGNIISGLLDDNTGENVTYSKVANYADGTPMKDDYIDGVIYFKKGQEYFIRNFSGNILPKWFGIDNTGKVLNTQATLNKWLNACKAIGGTVYLPVGTYLFPIDFQYDFGQGDFSLIGEDEAKTIITTYDGTAATNFAIPERISINQANRYKDGVYQIDVNGPTVHKDFSGLSNKELDSYIEIKNGVATSLTGNVVEKLKSIGYVTELNTTDPNDPTKDIAAEPANMADGIYVVAKHGSLITGGAYTHNTLPWKGTPKYIQGTILKRSGGTWSWYYTGAGFVCQGNYKVTNVTFNNVQFYLFSPLSLSKKLAPEANIFQIQNCTFKHCSRVLCLMSASTNYMKQYDTWFQYGEYYGDGSAYTKFEISDCEFSYIHTSIAWALPPAKNYLFYRNYVHDCYTLITVFHNSPYRMPKDVLTVNTILSNNTFLRIRPLNMVADGYFTVVRTYGNAIISNNVFDDIATLRPLYICSTNALVEGNIIKMHTFDYGNIKQIINEPLILSKYTWGQGSITSSTGQYNIDGGEIKIANNTIVAGTYSVFGCEGTPSISIDNNTIYLYASNRYITTNSTALDTKKIYHIINLPTFQRIASAGGYDPAIAANDFVYYNIRTGIWSKFSNHINTPTVYSKTESIPAPSPSYIKITNNLIESDCITFFTSNAPSPGNILSNILIENNQLYYTRYMHGGGNSIIDNYNISNNTFQYGGISHVGLSPLTTQINNLVVKNNTFMKSINYGFQLGAAKLVDIEGNIFTYNNAQYNENTYKDITQSMPATEVLNITGNDNSKIIIKNNTFNAASSNGFPLVINQPDKLYISNNVFDLNMEPWAAKSAVHPAINIATKTSNPTIEITDNTINPGQKGNGNNDLVDFDNAPGKISSLLIDNNHLTDSSAQLNRTIQAPNKTIVNYIKGKNTFNGAENIGTINSKVTR